MESEMLNMFNSVVFLFLEYGNSPCASAGGPEESVI